MSASRNFLLPVLYGFSLVILVHAHNPQANDTEYVVSACFNQSNKVLVLNCTAGHMVRINQVFYGYSPLGSCGHTHGDCIKDVPQGENYPCVGHHTCGLNLPSGEVGRVIPSCDKHTTYMQAHYMCIDVSEAVDICRVDNITGLQKGYVKTPQYPINYPTHTECSVRITAPFPSQRIRLYAIDFQLETNDSRCPDLLKVSDALKGHSACGARAREHLFTSNSNWINIEFISNHENRNKGFWLYFEAQPFMTLTTTTTSTTTPASSTSTTTPSAVVSSTGRSSTKHSIPVLAPNTTVEATTQAVNPTVHIVYGQDDKFPLGILVGVFLGALLVVLVILLIVLLLKRRNGSGLTNSSSVTSQTAFLGTKNNLHQAGQIHCINNHLYTTSSESSASKNTYKPETNTLAVYTADNSSTANNISNESAIDVEPPGDVTTDKEHDIELDLKDEKYLALKRPYIDIGETGEETLYC